MIVQAFTITGLSWIYLPILSPSPPTSEQRAQATSCGGGTGLRRFRPPNLLYLCFCNRSLVRCRVFWTARCGRENCSLGLLPSTFLEPIHIELHVIERDVEE